MQADLVLLPFMERFHLVMQEFLGIGLDKMHGGSIQAWLESLQRRESCQIASADHSRLLEAYRCVVKCMLWIAYGVTMLDCQRTGLLLESVAHCGGAVRHLKPDTQAPSWTVVFCHAALTQASETSFHAMLPNSLTMQAFGDLIPC